MKQHAGGQKGFSAIESVGVVALIGSLAALAAPTAGKWIRRSGDVAAYSTMRQVFAVARLEAVRRQANVVVEITKTSNGRIRLRTFQDRANDGTLPLPADELAAAANFVLDEGTFATSPTTDEPILSDITLGSRVRFWKQGETKDDPGSAIHFDTYAGNTSLLDRIAFLPSGGIAVPQDANSGQPTSSGGRGIYFADWQGKNFFRVTIDSDLTGRCRADKYVEGSGYRAVGWKWK